MCANHWHCGTMVISFLWWRWYDSKHSVSFCQRDRYRLLLCKLTHKLHCIALHYALQIVSSAIYSHDKVQNFNFNLKLHKTVPIDTFIDTMGIRYISLSAIRFSNAEQEEEEEATYKHFDFNHSFVRACMCSILVAKCTQVQNGTMHIMCIGDDFMHKCTCCGAMRCNQMDWVKGICIRCFFFHIEICDSLILPCVASHLMFFSSFDDVVVVVLR